MQAFDVVIVGGAMTGTVLALALSSATQDRLRIAIVEKALPNYAEQGGFDARAIALAHGTLQKMAKIRPLAFSPHAPDLAACVAQIATPIRQIQVSDQGHFGKTTLCAEDLALDKLGVVVELAKLGEQLQAWRDKLPNIRLFCPDQVVNIDRTSTACQLTLASGSVLHCALLVAADGIGSQVAQACGVATETLRDYQQSAIIANVAISEPHNGRAFERFTAEGPFALLPLGEKRMSLVWCVRDPSQTMALSDPAFLAAVQRQFGWQLGRFERVSKRFVYPLFSQKAQAHHHHRLAIVGNAAQLLHPVAGQGFNLGMRDLFALAQCVGKAFAQGQDIGDARLLQQFEQARQPDQQRIMQQTSGLISLFCCDFLPVQAGRNAALLALNHCTALRNQVAHRALGW